MDEPLCELETDKVTVEVPALAAGVMGPIEAEEGATVEVGALLGSIEEGSGAAAKPTAPATPAPATSVEAPAKATAPQPAPAGSAGAEKSGPAARRVIAEAGLDANSIQGTGKDGRITKADALAAARNPVSPVAAAYQEAGVREERVKMTRLRQRIAERLKEAQNTAAMLTTFNEIDMTNVMAARKKFQDDFEKRHGCRLGFMSFFVKACIVALKELPAVNAEIDGDELIYKNYYDIGVAVGTEQGLVVPVLRDADKKSFAEVEKGITDLGFRARDGKLGMDELTGGTFTITNGGVYGSLMSTPIINPPQSGILGMHKIDRRPVAVGDSIEIRPMMYVALSYDHRIIDGREAVTFLVRVKECIEDPERILLAV